MKKCGLIGEKLTHSYSPQIHAALGAYSYSLFEIAKEALPAFLQARDFDGINVTIPYKKAVLPYCTVLSPLAERLQSVNTIVRTKDGGLYGHNTDYFGFSYMLTKMGASPAGKKVVILGSGGAAATAEAVCRDMGAGAVVIISRSGENHYGNLSNHADAEILVNTTPVGMYPETGKAPVSLLKFPKCSAVLDILYNPDKTALLLEAETLGIPCQNGLPMLVAQAKESAELFAGTPIGDEQIEKILSGLKKKQKNLVLIGMPGCGKSTIARAVAEKMGRRMVDTDAEIEAAAGMRIPEIFQNEGEEGFRRRETEIIKQYGKECGLILATGGGCVTRAENAPHLRQNGVILWVQRDINQLARGGRPLSETADLAVMYQARAPLYAALADIEIENQASEAEITERVIRLYENSCD